MNHPEFLQIMAYLEAGSGTRVPVTETQAEVYWDMLGTLEFVDVKRAAKLALAESEFPTIPPVGVLLRLAGAGKIETANRALIAYSHASRAVQSVGGYGSIDFSDPLVNAVIRDLGGWNRFTEWPCDSVQWRKRDFIQQYQALEQCGVSGEFCAPLTGIVGTSNQAGGFIEKLPEPVRIECGLPPHRPGLISGPIPKFEPKRISESSIKRIEQAVEIAAGSRVIPEDGGRPQRPAPEPLTEAEFESRRAAQLAKVRSRTAVENLTVEDLIGGAES